jgi:tetratricopeptide (TPR) repeat protein
MTTTTARSALWTEPATPGVALRHLWQVPMFLVGVLALAGVCVARPTWREGDSRQFERDVAKVRKFGDQGNLDLAGALGLVDNLLARAEALPDRAGELYFLVGSCHIRAAEMTTGSESQDHARAARSYFHEAERLGVPIGDCDRLAYRLGKALFYTDADLPTVISYLDRSIASGADDPFVGYGLLVQAYLRLPSPDLPAALKANSAQLQVPLVDEERLAPVRLLRGELLLKLEKPEEARKVLASIGVGSPADVQARARYLRARSFQEESRWAEAVGLWREALDEKTGSPGERGVALYYFGVCCRHLDRLGEAASAWDECARQCTGDEACAAALGLADLRLLDRDPTPALEAFRRAVRDMKAPADWHNTLYELTPARELFERGCSVCRQSGNFDGSIQLSHLYERLAPPGAAHALRGQAAYEWGKAKLTQGALAPGGQDTEDARALLRQAGDAYEQAAALVPMSEDQTGNLWLSANAFVEGQQPDRAVSVLDQLLKLSLPPARQGEAWYLLAEAQRALKNDAAAGAAYGECVQFDQTPFAFRARFHLAKAERTKGHIDEAKEALEQNLRFLSLETSPDDEAMKATLFELADLQFQRQEYRRAAVHLEQAVNKYSVTAGGMAARYQLAECYLELAKQDVRNLMVNARMDAASREHFVRESQHHMTQAAEKYQELLQLLEKKAADGALVGDETRLLPKAGLRAAECRFSLGEYVVARERYEQLAKRYGGRAEYLHALMGVARCYWSEGKPDRAAKAREVIDTLRQALAAMDEKAFETDPEGWNRQKWEQWLEEVSRRVPAL